MIHSHLEGFLSCLIILDQGQVPLCMCSPHKRARDQWLQAVHSVGLSAPRRYMQSSAGLQNSLWRNSVSAYAVARSFLQDQFMYIQPSDVYHSTIAWMRLLSAARKCEGSYDLRRSYHEREESGAASGHTKPTNTPPRSSYGFWNI